MSQLSSLVRRNAPALERLRNGDLDTQELLVQLLTTSCLLEVSKLLSGGVDLATFATGTIDVLTQFAPIDHCLIRIEAPGVPSVAATLGEPPADLDDRLMESVRNGQLPSDERVSGGVLRATDEAVGYLAAVDLAAPLLASGFVHQLAEQISDGLTTMVESERTRRRLAAARAVELASKIDESYEREDLLGYVQAIAELSNAVGARLTLHGSRLGGVVVLDAGLPVDVDPALDPAAQEVEAALRTTHDVEIDEAARLSVNLRWAMPPADAELAALAASIEALVAALRRAERAARLIDQAETDELTGLGNRRRALRALSAARTRAEREGGSFAVLLFDLDHFKSVNDTLGHGVGDAVLAAFAAMLRNSIRDDDRATRWGGEEFLLICPETDAAQAEALGRRLLANVPVACAPVLPDGWHQTASIGIASYPVHGETPTAVVHAADDALYKAKAAGRNDLHLAGAPS